MYKCLYFDIKELVSSRVYDARGEKAWALLDPRALQTLDALREKFGPCTVNDWAFSGANEFRGFRESQCEVGVKYSQHRYGRAFDCHFKNATAEEVRAYILANHNEFSFISSLEMNVSWLHFDVRNHSPGILKFYP